MAIRHSFIASRGCAGAGNTCSAAASPRRPVCMSFPTVPPAGHRACPVLPAIRRTHGNTVLCIRRPCPGSPSHRGCHGSPGRSFPVLQLVHQAEDAAGQPPRPHKKANVRQRRHTSTAPINISSQVAIRSVPATCT